MSNEPSGEQRTGFQQDDQLRQLSESGRDCTVITVNGARIQGKIEAFDRFVIVVRTSAGKQSLIYKHAVSTIIAEKAK
ncbi:MULTISPECIES: RNA chaperone Hfq [Saccharibacillus]|uniref:RNA chaperone Hfq n=1 Tax=Saccharibacillus TaxID=456492 RepID=UPI001551C430|nr:MULTISPECIES: RNA chaperone Hfq [Saccharibacillus]